MTRGRSKTRRNITCAHHAKKNIVFSVHDLLYAEKIAKPREKIKKTIENEEMFRKILLETKLNYSPFSQIWKTSHRKLRKLLKAKGVDSF